MTEMQNANRKMQNIGNESFLQSREWEEFQSVAGKATFRVDGQLVVKNNLPLGMSYLTSFYPEINNLEKFIQEIQALTKKENSIFLHLEIKEELRIKNKEFRIKPAKNFQPKQTLILDIAKSEEEILARMHQKTRYNINLATKKGLIVNITHDIKDVELFWRVAEETSTRSDFHYHNKVYYQKMLEILGKKHGILDLIICGVPEVLPSGEISPREAINYGYKYPIKPLAAVFVLYYKGQAIYLHGASSNKDRNLMAPYLAQWTGICEAKKRDCKTYDFWGVAPLEVENEKLKIKNEEHPWNGITRFKLGFAPKGRYVEYSQAQDIVSKGFWYSLYKILKKK